MVDKDTEQGQAPVSKQFVSIVGTRGESHGQGLSYTFTRVPKAWRTVSPPTLLTALAEELEA